MPTMWCGLPTVVSQAQADKWKWDQKKLAGKLVNYTEYRDEPAGPVTIGTAKEPSFFLISTFVSSKKQSSHMQPDSINPLSPAHSDTLFKIGYLNPSEPEDWPIGLDPCAEYTVAYTQENGKNLIWCTTPWPEFHTMPLASSLRSKDYSRDPERNNIDYWINTVAETMLHEMHHVFIDLSRDVSLWPPLKFFQPGGPDETFDTAYEYAGVTALADQRTEQVHSDMIDKQMSSVGRRYQPFSTHCKTQLDSRTLRITIQCAHQCPRPRHPNEGNCTLQDVFRQRSDPIFLLCRTQASIALASLGE